MCDSTSQQDDFTFGELIIQQVGVSTC